ncbi:MAG: putative rane protein [Frankiales bacterium]|nr:putative rane protein [Frankiales bacterium]
MPHLDPTWQSSAAIAAVVVLLSLLARARRWTRIGAALTEASIVLILYTSWQWLGSITHRNVVGARSNALAVWHTEQALHLPSELAVQQLVLPHPWLAQLCNGYYLYGHFNPMIALLGWVWLRHREAYGRTRLYLCGLTALAFVAHFIPVAPPRLTPGLGFHDLALDYGQSVYGTFNDGLSGQLLAMPSLHVGWAVLVAYVVVTTARSRWRWLVVLHPVVMALVVAATANHWWADGAVSAALLAVVVLADRTARKALQPATPAPVLSPARTLTP